MIRKILIVALVCYPVFFAFAKKKKKLEKKVEITTPDSIDYRKIGSPLPTVRFFRKDGKYITNETIKNDAHLIVMMFNPTCEHCEEQAIKFKENIFLFRKTNLVLVAAAIMVPHLGFFTNNTKINDYPSIQVSVDSSDFINKTFIYQPLPQINIYDKNRKLIKIFSGETTMDSLKQFID
jgi:hypothetical protein